MKYVLIAMWITKAGMPGGFSADFDNKAACDNASHYVLDFVHINAADTKITTAQCLAKSQTP
jgi:hypothetical protein